MTDLFGIGELSVTDSGLIVLAAVILGLLVIAVAFSVYALALRLRHERREKLKARLTERWESPVLAAIADPDKVPEVHALVRPEHRLDFVDFVLGYARRVRGGERETLRKLVEPYLEEVAGRTDDSRSEVRTRAVQTLGTLGLPRYSEEVLEGLDDPSPLVSMVAARYLARPEYPQYAGSIMKHLHRFGGWNRRFLASMLATMGPEVSPVLRDGLVDAEQPAWLRVVYAEGLRMQADPRAADVAAEALAGVEDRDLAASLLRLLAEVGRPEHVDVARALCDADDEIIRAQALHALGVLGGTPELPLLFAGMEDPSAWAALHAARGVRHAGGAEMLEEIARSDGEQARLAGQVLFEEEEP
jgi:HEAT repeat protein